MPKNVWNIIACASIFVHVSNTWLVYLGVGIWPCWMALFSSILDFLILVFLIYILHKKLTFYFLDDKFDAFALWILITMCRKQLKDPFSMVQLHETIIQILELFMGIGGPNYWISYLIPENAIAYRQLMVTSTNGFDDSCIIMDVSKLEQLMSETRMVLSRYANHVSFPQKKLILIWIPMGDVVCHLIFFCRSNQNLFQT